MEFIIRVGEKGKRKNSRRLKADALVFTLLPTILFGRDHKGKNVRLIGLGAPPAVLLEINTGRNRVCKPRGCPQPVRWGGAGYSWQVPQPPRGGVGWLHPCALSSSGPGGRRGTLPRGEARPSVGKAWIFLWLSGGIALLMFMFHLQ